MFESKAVAAGGSCLSTGDQAAIQGVIDAQTTNIATALAGGTLQDCPADLMTCEDDLATCEAFQHHLPATRRRHAGTPPDR